MTNKNLLCLIVVLSAIILGNSCKKDTGIIGLDLHDRDSQIQLSTDSSATVKTYSIKYDSILNNTNTRGLIGKFEDPDFGTSSSVFITQIVPQNNEPNIDRLVFDSISFDFQINTIYGNIASTAKIEIFEVTESLTGKDSIYSNDLNIDNYLSVPLNYGETLISLDTVKINTDTSMVSVRLNEYAENKLFNPIDSLFVKLVEDDSAFVEDFYGICIRMTHLNTPNSFIGFSISETNSLNVHFTRYDTLYANTDTIKIVPTPSKFAYYLTSGNGFNVFSHHYNSSINFNDSTRNDSITYVESMSGLNTIINLEGLEKWKDSTDVIINNALLYVYFDSLYTDELIPPQQILPFQHSNEILNFALTDYVNSNGVELVYINNDRHQYAFRFTEYLQDYILGKSDNISIRLFPSENHSSARRARIYGGNHDLKPKIYITYSKI